MGMYMIEGKLEWTNINGDKIDLNEMSTSYISNTIKYIKEDRLCRSNVTDNMRYRWELYVKEFTMILRERNLNTLSIDIDEKDIGIEI